jgi:(2Fe-2S) ferredoxin
MDAADRAKIEQEFAQLKVDQATRHVFLCLGPKCCSYDEGKATWEVLKRRIKEAGIPALRTKADCLRVCVGGPWMVVYPEGVWYGEVTPDRCERIITEHLEQGKPIEKWVAHRHALG